MLIFNNKKIYGKIFGIVIEGKHFKINALWNILNII